MNQRLNNKLNNKQLNKILDQEGLDKKKLHSNNQVSIKIKLNKNQLTIQKLKSFNLIMTLIYQHNKLKN